ncbi:hypothetical protein EVAR_61536_1 [Eumeta japonica]|uniref:Uncharacterized protein n=1 Tax=Eumeta variegata TaxID=151549 RepID=A0A4C1YWW6_EUMVA|nr:hypothetical protein EVAR_61536_1 [Eumeta japonica]
MKYVRACACLCETVYMRARTYESVVTVQRDRRGAPGRQSAPTCNNMNAQCHILQLTVHARGRICEQLHIRQKISISPLPKCIFSPTLFVIDGLGSWSFAPTAEARGAAGSRRQRCYE